MFEGDNSQSDNSLSALCFVAEMMLRRLGFRQQRGDRFRPYVLTQIAGDRRQRDAPDALNLAQQLLHAQGLRFIRSMARTTSSSCESWAD